MNDNNTVPTSIMVYVVIAAVAAHQPGHYLTPPHPPDGHIEQTRVVSVGPSVSTAQVHVSTKALAQQIKHPDEVL